MRQFFTDEQVQNLLQHIQNDLGEGLDARVVCVYQSTFPGFNGLYYVKLRSDAPRNGILEFCLDLEFGASAPPSILREVKIPFHSSDFNILRHYELQKG